MDAATLEALAGGPTALAAATLLAGTALTGLTRDTRGEVIEGTCQSREGRTYALRADLRHRPPRVRCSCPARRRPCKHGLALLARWLSAPEAFRLTGQLEAPLLDLRAPAASPHLPLKRARWGQVPERRRLLRQGLGDARALLEELVRSGVEHLGAAERRSLHERADALAGLQLAGVGAGVRRILALLEPVDAGRDPQRVTTSIARLARLVSLGEAWLARMDTSPAGGDTAEKAQAQAQDAGRNDLTDAALETSLGRNWTLAELRAMGRATPLSLVEVAWWRREDPGFKARIDTSALVDLSSGAWFLESSIVPLHRAGKVAAKPSHRGVLELAEALVYPGSAPARVRWSPGAARTRIGGRADWERLLAHATPFAAVREAAAADPFREGPCFALLAVDRAVLRDGGVTLVDPHGACVAIDAMAAAVLSRWGAPRTRWAAAVSTGDDRRERGVTLHAVITQEGLVRVGG